MLHSTFNLAKKAGVCKESYHKMAKYLGGVRQYGADKLNAMSILGHKEFLNV